MATTLPPYRTGLCQMGNHDLCRGEYSFAACACSCHLTCPVCGQKKPT